MSASRRNLHRPLDVLLTLHVGEVVLVAVEAVIEGMGHVNPGGLNGDALVKKVNHLLDVGRAKHVDAIHDGGLPRILDG